jgi:hypothetical protein
VIPKHENPPVPIAGVRAAVNEVHPLVPKHAMSEAVGRAPPVQAVVVVKLVLLSALLIVAAWVPAGSKASSVRALRRRVRAGALLGRGERLRVA